MLPYRPFHTKKRLDLFQKHNHGLRDSQTLSWDQMQLREIPQNIVGNDDFIVKDYHDSEKDDIDEKAIGDEKEKRKQEQGKRKEEQARESVRQLLHDIMPKKKDSRANPRTKNPPFNSFEQRLEKLDLESLKLLHGRILNSSK